MTGATAASSAMEVPTVPVAPTATIDRVAAALKPPTIKPLRISRGAAPIRQAASGATLNDVGLLLLSQAGTLALDADDTDVDRRPVEPTEATHQEEIDELFAGLDAVVDAVGEYVASVGF